MNSMASNIGFRKARLPLFSNCGLNESNKSESHFMPVSLTPCYLNVVKPAARPKRGGRLGDDPEGPDAQLLLHLARERPPRRLARLDTALREANEEIYFRQTGFRFQKSHLTCFGQVGMFETGSIISPLIFISTSIVPPFGCPIQRTHS